jgi:hypothetical protein
LASWIVRGRRPRRPRLPLKIDGNFCGGEFLTVDLVYGPQRLDSYAFDLKAGESATIALTQLNSLNADVTLLGPDGNGLARGSAGLTKNVDQVISNFRATETGTHYLTVAG